MSWWKKLLGKEKSSVRKGNEEFTSEFLKWEKGTREIFDQMRKMHNKPTGTSRRELLLRYYRAMMLSPFANDKNNEKLKTFLKENKVYS